ncbi:MAG: hypothetical protein EOP42_22370, partial [Sphingobacteriaceae bacterium]
VAALLKSRRIKADWVLDEGGEITRKEIPGLQGKPVALIGTSEKGYLSVNLKVNIEGGHSSMPKPETAVDVLITAIQKLRAKPFPASFGGSTGDFFRYLGPEMPFTSKMAIANQWLFKPLLFSIYEKSAGGNALLSGLSRSEIEIVLKRMPCCKCAIALSLAKTAFAAG